MHDWGTAVWPLFVGLETTPTVFLQLFIVNYGYFLAISVYRKTKLSIQDIVSLARQNTTGSSSSKNSSWRGSLASGYFGAIPQLIKDDKENLFRPAKVAIKHKVYYMTKRYQSGQKKYFWSSTPFLLLPLFLAKETASGIMLPLSPIDTELKDPQ